MLDKLTADDFKPYLNTTFRIQLGPEDDPLAVKLVEVTALNQKGPRQQSFSLIFQGPPDYYLPQRIYTVEHGELPPLDIFLVPIRPDKEGMRVQAIFN